DAGGQDQERTSRWRSYSLLLAQRMLKASRPSDCQLSFSQLGENPRRTTCSGYARDEEPSALALPDTLDPLVVDYPARLAQERGSRLDTAAPTSASSELPVAIEIAGPTRNMVVDNRVGGGRAIIKIPKFELASDRLDKLGV